MIMDGNVSFVSLGFSHTAVITDDGSLWTWGFNEFGQLGNGTSENSSIPVKVMENAAFVSAGGNHTMVITDDGSLWAFGATANGRLGDGTFGHRHTPMNVMGGVLLR